MRIACLQFAPQVGDVDNNLNRADAVLSRANPQDLDLIVLPELAFSGYNFKSLEHITPYLEPTASGITSLWARTTALKYECVVTVGYPEKVDITEKWPASPEYYNSAITVNADGETIANYRKTFLYYCDETWALEGPDGFFDGVIPGLGNVAMGICKWPTRNFERMDLNPYKFEVPWTAWEFAYHILRKQANLVILSMAWLTRQDASVYSSEPKEPDMETLSYWISRLEPVIRAEDEGEVIVVLANRCGVEGEAVYAGTSCVLGIQSGEVKLYGILGRGQRDLLVVDTSNPPQAKLVAEPNTNVAGNMAQSRNAPKPEPKTLAPKDIEPQGLVNKELLASIDAVLADVTPVSPVEPRSPHAYFSSQSPRAEDVLSNLKSSGPSGDSPGPSSIPSPIPVLKRPSSPKSRNSSRTRTSEPPVILERRQQELEITPIVGLSLDIQDISAPDSASSMTVNTPWDKSPGLFRAEDIVNIIKSSSPVISSGGSNPPSSMPSNRPQSPKSRNASRTRQPLQEAALVAHDLINEPAIAPIVVPIGETQISPLRHPNSKQTSNRGLVPHEERSTSPRPQSTGW